MEHCRLRRVRNDRHVGQCGECLAGDSSPLDERRHQRQRFVEPDLGAGEVGKRREEAAAVADLPNTRLGDKVLRSCECAAGWGTKIFVEGDVDGIEVRRDLVKWSLVEEAALPKSRSIEVEECAASSCGCTRGDEIVPDRQPAAEVSLWQLEEDCRDRFRKLVDVAWFNEPLTATE